MIATLKGLIMTIGIKRFTKISNIGVFPSYQSPSDGSLDFKKFNLIYGFNGSGKTTVSRIFQSLGTKVYSQNLEPRGGFEILYNDSSKISSQNLSSLQHSQIKVFNADFVWTNLKWGQNQTEPLYYIGQTQAYNKTRLEQCKSLLERRYIPKQKELNASLDKTEKELKKHNKESAQFIKNNVYIETPFTAIHLEQHYNEIKESGKQTLPNDVLEQLGELRKEVDPKRKIEYLAIPEDLNLKTLIDSAYKLCTARIIQDSVEELTKHSEMSNWVARGKAYHEEQNLETCLLCGNILTKARAEALNAHFDDKYHRLINETQSLIERFEEIQFITEKAAGDLPDSSSFYKDLAPNYLKSEECFKKVCSQLKSISLKCVDRLRTKINSELNNILELGLDLADTPEKIEAHYKDCLKNICEVINEHNSRTDTHAQSRETAKRRLCLHFASEYFDTYREHIAKKESLAKGLVLVAKKINFYESRSRVFSEKVSSKGPAVNIINDYLYQYFGHRELQLKLTADGYMICRNGTKTETPLSEGEKTALSFCYFITTLEEHGQKIHDHVIVIDDPISSLDIGAIHSAVGFIKQKLFQSKQLFVLTHNLYFMKEIKRWYKKQCKNDYILLTLESNIRANGKRQSIFKLMSSPLAKHDSEYHYLFAKVYSLSRDSSPDPEVMYNLPNVIRKVGETFLYFKYGYTSLHDQKAEELLTQMLGPTRVSLLQNLPNTESHATTDALENLSSINIEGTRKASIALMELIKKTDEEHFNHLKGSLG